MVLVLCVRFIVTSVLPPKAQPADETKPEIQYAQSLEPCTPMFEKIIPSSRLSAYQRAAVIFTPISANADLLSFFKNVQREGIWINT